MTDLLAPVCSITTTQRRRYFWAAWWTGPPTRVPFRKPDASDGGASTPEEAKARAEAAAGRPLTLIPPTFARAWMRILRGQSPWPDRSAGPRPASATPGPAPQRSIWVVLQVSAEATEDELRAAFRRRALETHPDQGGSAEAFREVLRAFEEARRRRRRPRRRRP